MWVINISTPWFDSYMMIAVADHLLNEVAREAAWAFRIAREYDAGRGCYKDLLSRESDILDAIDVARDRIENLKGTFAEILPRPGERGHVGMEHE